MCGRYTIRRADVGAAALRALNMPLFEEFTELKIVPRFNIAPSQSAPVIRLNAAGKAAAGEVRWGLIPSWTKGKPKMQPINARAENVATSAMFRQALERRRCLVPADGFYEWHGSKPPKQPYFIRRKDDGLFMFAGLWERWKPDDDAEPIDTFTLITTTPNELMSPIHNRMPVILGPADYGKWLDRDAGAEEAMKLLRPYPAEEMEAWPISARVNRVGNDGPELLEKV
ncbi:MAG: response-associated peptidase [Phycisphaerales bacterium]|nr:response-associated peptidase [Phycisphaerales bacterium]